MSITQPCLSIVIKTFNEEAKVARAIESALAVGPVLQRSVEVVVADSVSTDHTTEIACRYPVRVVQFVDPTERGCGAGVELGFQHASGRFIYFLDGDMVLEPAFVLAAVGLLEAEPGLAGVGGVIQDTSIVNIVDRIRVNNKAVSLAGNCRWLEGGGLYRREAIAAAGGYAANRNLKGYEEAELGMRLRAAGWQLRRLPQQAVAHTGHALGTWALLARHWRSRRAMSGGVLLRAALGKPWLAEACRMLAHPLGVALAWLAFLLLMLLAGPWHMLVLAGWGILCLIGVLVLWLVKRDAQHVVLSVVSWHYGALAAMLGAMEPVLPVGAPIAARVLRDIDLAEPPRA